MSTVTKAFLPTRKTLLSRLRHCDDQESWNDFFETYWKLIYSTAIRAGLTDAEAQDVVQETVIAVSRQMAEHKYDARSGTFKTWLLRLTRWRIIDQLRQRPIIAEGPRNKATGNCRTSTVDRIPDPVNSQLDLLWDEEWEKTIVDAAISRVKREADPKQYQLFHLRVLKQWPVKKITQTLNISASQVYLAKHRVSRLVRQEIERLQTEIP